MIYPQDIRYIDAREAHDIIADARQGRIPYPTALDRLERLLGPPRGASDLAIALELNRQHESTYQFP